MSERGRLLQSIATITGDYQAGVLPTPSPAHVERWINQFPALAQQPILAEMEHVLAKTYYSKDRVTAFLRSVIGHKEWTGDDAAAFWHQVHFLNLQPQGNSQRQLLALFDAELRKQCGLTVAQCGQGNKFLYLDDGLFSGGRIGSDLSAWITGPAPKNAELMIAVIALHTQGEFFTKKNLNEANEKAKKNITIKWGRRIAIEDGLFKVDVSDVLRPNDPGQDAAIAGYVATLGKAPSWRTGTSIGPQAFFSSGQGRQTLEQEFFRAGIRVRAMCPNLNVYQRPLGNTLMKTVGFGTMFATYRNCPNNAPLVLWAGDPWYPLLRRVTN